MSSVVTRLPTDERDSADVPANLARWYAAHSSIRRLWAVEHRDELIAFVALEPTSDGDDMLPTWLAKRHEWTQELQSLANREIQLELIFSDDFQPSYVNSDAVLIAELNWRDAWASTWLIPQ
jgi:hypothetical protein